MPREIALAERLACSYGFPSAILRTPRLRFRAAISLCADRATVSEAVRWTIDSKAVKAEMGSAWWDANCQQSLVTTVAVKARTGAVRLAA